VKQYDAIIIGGGINSLVAAGLLGQAGNDVILFESKKKLGGMASTEDFYPGYRCNMIYDYIPWIDTRLIDKLNLYQYDLNFFSVDPHRIALDKNGDHLIFYEDPVKTAASITQHSLQDAEKWLHFTQYIDKLTQFLEPIYRTTPPIIKKLGIKDAIALKSIFKPLRNHGTRGLVDILRTIPMMMPELMDEWFESKLLRGSLSSSGITHLTQGPYSAATVLNFLHQHILSNGIIHNSHFIKGGTEMFVQALSQATQERNVDIRLNTQVTSINSNNRICTGITIADGHTFYGHKIISGLDPGHTFFKLFDAAEIPPTFRTQLKNIKYRGSTARVHFALNNLPNILGITAEKLESLFTINPSIEYLERAYDDAKYGQISNTPYIEFSIPSLINPNYSPSGKHVLSATIQYIPYQLCNNILKENTIHNVIQILERYIPAFTQLIEDTLLMTPQDFETSLGLSEGNFNHGEMTLDQYYIMRPTLNSAQYSTPVQNLFLCGPGTHPGGGLHGTNAMNAIKEVSNR